MCSVILATCDQELPLSFHIMLEWSYTHTVVEVVHSDTKVEIRLRVITATKY